MTDVAVSARDRAVEAGLTASEFDEIVSHLDREPNDVEIAVFAGMWSEHCSYKSTRRLLARLPTSSPRVLAGPGAHAGTVDIGDGWAVAFKVESHNHPSAVEPYQGALTGVGGILRDIVAQGARPTAVMDGLCFGEPGTPRTRFLRDGVVDGIGGYGNAYGVPNVGGIIRYDRRFDGNPLVNALAAGLVRHDEMRSAAATGEGNALLIVGATTGRDGILGAAFASEELGDVDDHRSSRSHIQVGDPFTGKKLMEAFLAFTRDDGFIAGQDLGACGIACATSEMAAAGGVGFDVDLDAVPLREGGMTAAEVLLSESQERFMLVVSRDAATAAVAHFHAHGVEAAVCGTVTDTGRVRVRHDGTVVADLPASLVADGTPDAVWPVARALPTPEPYPDVPLPGDPAAVLLDLLSQPDMRDPSPIIERYDQTVGNRTMRGPGTASAAVMILPGGDRGYALTMVADGARCAVDPYRGVQALLGQAVRDLACVGAEAVAVTDGINAGSPSDPIEYLRLAEVIRGLGDGLRTIDMPVTGGNCSLYNESPTGAVPPTPIIGALGVIEDRRAVPSPVMSEGDVVLLVGDLVSEPTLSRYGAASAGSVSGPAPLADVGADAATARFVVATCAAGLVRSATSVGRGGAVTALAKHCVRSGLGARLHMEVGERPDWALFGEYPGLVWITVRSEDVGEVLDTAAASGVPTTMAGSVGGDHLLVDGFLDVSIADVARAWEGSS